MKKTIEYLFVFSTDSMNLFPNNNGSSFRQPIPPHISREWEIGLKEVYIKISPTLPVKHLLICCEQIRKGLCGNNEFGILKQTKFNLEWQ